MANSDDYMALLEQILENQEAQKEAFEEFKEEVLEKLANLGYMAGEGFEVN